MKYFKWEIDYLNRLKEESNKLMLRHGFTPTELDFGFLSNKKDLDAQDLDRLARLRIIHIKYVVLVSLISIVLMVLWYKAMVFMG